MDTELFTSLVGSVGFPIAVAFYVLIRVEKGIKELTNTVHELALALAKLAVERHEGMESDGIQRR